MKRSAVLIGVGTIVLAIAILGGLSLMSSESNEKTKNETVQMMMESDLQKQEKNVSNSVKCSSDAFGRMTCSP